MADLITTVGTVAAVFLTLGLFSILYKENPWYRIAESIYLGLAIGYGVAFDLKYIRDQWGGKWSTNTIYMVGFVLALIFGILWYARFNKKYFFLYRWPLAIVVGTGLGLALRTVIFAQFTQQLLPQVKLNLLLTSNPWQMFNNILMFLMVPAVLLYFWFTGSAQENPAMKIVNTFARYTMMLGFGYSFGATVLTRYSLFIGRSQFLLGITPNPPEARWAFIFFAILMLGSMIGWDLYKKQKM